jgi:hypothetical protein
LVEPLKFDQWARTARSALKLYVVVETFQFLGAPTGIAREGGGARLDLNERPARGARPAWQMEWTSSRL